MRKKNVKPKTLDMELAVSSYFGVRKNLIVPNVFWGMFEYEVDLCILSPAGYATEVEIKVDRSDLIKDKEKRHGHKSDLIKYLYFAIPTHLEKDIGHIPERAGIIVVKWNPPWDNRIYAGRMAEGWWSCKKVREPKIQARYKWTVQQRLDLLRLGTMRVWKLKEKLQKALIKP